MSDKEEMTNEEFDNVIVLNDDEGNEVEFEWLDTIEKRLKYGRWLCGHWHIDKKIDDFRFVMEDSIL